MEANLSDGESETQSVAAGEAEAADSNPDETERELLKRIEQRKYQQRFANFEQDEDESRMNLMRRSSEVWGRKSITHKLMMRRSSTFVPGQSLAAGAASAQVSESVASSKESVKPPRTQSEQTQQPKVMLFKKVVN